MTEPTDEQIIIEAHRRWSEEYQVGRDGLPASPSLEHFVINVMREGWKPPKPPKPPVDPDVLAYRKWAKVQYPAGCGGAIDAGEWDGEDECGVFLAGVRYAREDAAQRAKEALAAKVAAADVMRRALAERGEKA